MKKIYLSKDNKKIAGVFGGLGEHFEVDPTILRLIFIFITIFTGIMPGVITYFVGWMIMPKDKN